MKKILHVSAGGLNTGGVASVILGLTSELKEQFEFSCVVFNKRGEHEEEFMKYGKLHRINCYPVSGKREYGELILRPLKLYFGIRKICKSEKYDVIHCHNQRDAWICLMAAKHSKVPTRIVHAHVGKSLKKKSIIEKIYKDLSPIMLKKVATVKIGCSKEAGELLYGNNDFSIIHNSINIDKFLTKEKIQHKTINFIHVGRFNYAKNQEFVIETYANICKKLTNTYLYLVGYGEQSDEKRINELIDIYGIREYVKVVPGNKIEVLDIYAKSDYMIFPSRFEGFPLTLIEAQATHIQCYVSENIGKEVNFGLLKYLNLKDGADKWAEQIIYDIENDIKMKLDNNLIAKYDDKNIAAKYAQIYNDGFYKKE